ncbi:GH25 family lysozyme [Brachybacterium phenoliresistens]|uniref:Lysozyme n=1 Tax=Brachybacterium phenoliresistens TaxID=396014 RepID=Z9JX30_9MICO|nr:GH25 family lysozyme [Brachybacterium phenoliresistens]EWS82754.1 lysozyme [Brachybacterium phenoliresistens]
MSPYRPRHRRTPEPPQTSSTAPGGGHTRRHLLRAGAFGASAAVGIPALAAAPSAMAEGVVHQEIHGQDVSSWQGDVDWGRQWELGSRFAWVKATEGNTWKSPTFSSQYRGADRVGMPRGGYHFARPDTGDPITQCDAFLDGGGGWTPDGRTLPGMVDFETSPGRPANYGLSRSDLRSWISQFSSHYRENTGRRPVIYTNAHWWNDNVGSWTPRNSPLHIANYSYDPIASLPGRWWGWELWQYSPSGPFAGDSNVWYSGEDDFARFVAEVDYGANGI